MKFQQYTSPVMAKAVEDTTFYQYNRLVSLNEVGGEPQRFGMSLAAFHRENQERARPAGRTPCWPHQPTTTSARRTYGRASVCSPKCPTNGIASLSRWSKLNRNRRKAGYRLRAEPQRRVSALPDAAWRMAFDIVASRPAGCGGVGPALRARGSLYAQGWAEAKVHSSWINPDTEYEEATRDFVRRLFISRIRQLFLRDFLPFQERIAALGIFNSLSQLLLKLTSPGCAGHLSRQRSMGLQSCGPGQPARGGLRAAACGTAKEAIKDVC